MSESIEKQILLASPKAVRLSIGKLITLTGQPRNVLKYRVGQLLESDRLRLTATVNTERLGVLTLVEIRIKASRRMLKEELVDYVEQICMHLLRWPTPVCVTPSPDHIIALTYADTDKLLGELQATFALDTDEIMSQSPVHSHAPILLEPRRWTR